MELTITKHTQRGLEAVLTPDKGDPIIWPLAAMSRNIKVPTHDLVFREINMYWESVSANRRKQIFSVYKKIDEHFSDVMDIQYLQKSLTELVTELLELHPQHELAAFIPRCKITYPTSVKDGGVIQFQPNKTYDVPKYDRLLVLAMAIRVLTPVWSVYVAAMDKYVGKNHKELMALKLVTKSWIMNYKGFGELQDYIEANTKDDESSLSSIIGHVGSEMIPEWLLARICVRRLTTKKLSGDGQDNNLVSNIHSIVTQTLRSKDKTFAGYFKNKDVRNESDDNLSLLEEYKIKQTITEGDKAMFASPLKDLVRTTHQIDDTINPMTIEAAWANNQKALNCSVGPGQVRVMQWVCGGVLPVQSVAVLNKTEKLKLLTITQTVLHHWGYPQIAAYMVARAVDDGMQKVQVSENRARFPKELSARLGALYPHNPMHLKLTRPYVVEAVAKTAEDFSSTDWLIEGPEDLLGEVDEYMVDGSYVTPGDIQRNIAELAIYVAERNQ